MPADPRRDLQRRLERGDLREDVVVLFLTLVGANPAGLDPSGALRPCLEGGLRRAVAAEVGHPVLPEHVDLHFFAAGAGPVHGLEHAEDLSGASGASLFGTSASVCCVVTPPPGLEAGPLATALGSRIATLGPGNKPALAVRVLTELAEVAFDIQADPTRGLQVVDLTRPDVRAAHLPDVHLDRKHGIPSKVFGIFDSLRILQDLRVIEGLGIGTTTWVEQDTQEVVWAMRQATEVCKNPVLERLFIFLADGLLQQDRRSCHRWCASIPPSALRHVLGENPAKETICQTTTAVYEQQARLASYLSGSKLCVAFAALAGDILRRWTEDLAAEERDFITYAAPKLDGCPQLSVPQARGIFDRLQSRFVVLESLLRSREPAETTMQQIRRMPKDILSAAFRMPWRAGQIVEGSFFFLYPALAQRSDVPGPMLEEFADLLAQAFAAHPERNLRALLKAFIDDGEVAAWQRRDLFVAFISACRCPSPPELVQPRRCCLFGGATRAGGANELRAYPSTEGLELVVLEVVLGKFGSRSSREGEEGPKAEYGEMLETVLLVSTGDSLWRWSKDKVENDPRLADEARRFLNGVAGRHISNMMKSVAGSGRTTWYDDARFRELAEGRRPWAHFAGRAASRFSEHARALAKRPFEEFGQLLWMYFKLDFALDAGSLWNFMQTLEEGSECLASRFNKLAPPGSSLRMRMGEELQKAAGENQLELGEYDHLLRYFGFFNPSYQSFVRRGRALAESRTRFRGAAAPAGSGAAGAQARASDLFMGLLEATVKLISMAGPPTELSTEEVILEISDRCGGHYVHQRLFGRVIEAVQRMDPHSSDGFGLAQLLECAKELGRSGQMLAHKVDKRGAPASLVDGVCTAIQALLQRTAPVGWAESLKGLDTVIFALEYMSKEDLDLAYQQFEAECRCQQQDSLLELLECAKKVYRQPLAGSDPGSVSPTDDIAQVIHRNSPSFDRKVVWRGVAFDQTDWQRILAIAAAAAETMRERYNVTMLPHHTQMITLVMFAIRTCGARFAGLAGRRLPKTMLARVGTGEGKSLVIAMLAAFAAARGLRAHVVNDNRVLAQRDFRANLPLFQRLGIVASDDRDDLKVKTCQVVYCTGDDVEKSCLENLLEGRVEDYEEGLKEAVLIVDEVDGLIFDKGTVSNEVFEDREFSEWANNWLRQLDLKGEIERDWEDFRAHGECSLTIQREVEEAYQQIGLRHEGSDYAVRGNTPYMIDKKTGLIKEEEWSLWLEVLKRNRRDGAYYVTYKYVKAVLCRLQCFMSYACIFGLTGSLGQNSERLYLQEHYEAIAFNVPFFLDTCRAPPGPERRHLAVGSRVVVKTENSEGCVELDRIGTAGLVGRIVDASPQERTYTLELGDGRRLEYQQHWVARGRFQGRNLPQEVGNGEPLPNREVQEEAIVELAVQKCTKVPVLIVMKDSDAVRRLADALRRRLLDDNMLPYPGAEETAVVELLHNPRDPQDFVRRVELATEALEQAAPLASAHVPSHAAATVAAGEWSPIAPAWDAGYDGYDGAGLAYGDGAGGWQPWEDPWPQAAPDRPRQRWRITLATAEGGRGHDYRVTDPVVDDAGGLMLILSWVPWSEREWIQFLGRTARQDHVGQYAVLLNREDEQVRAALQDRGPGESPARAILRRGDYETASSLQGKREEIEKGRLMHKLTSRYWTLHKVERTSKKQDWEWKRLCEQYLDKSPDSIQQTFCSVIVTPKELILGFAKLNPNTPTPSGLSEMQCASCGTTNVFPSPGMGQRLPTVRCGQCGVTSD